jgi:hypothetical protein
MPPRKAPTPTAVPKPALKATPVKKIALKKPTPQPAGQDDLSALDPPTPLQHYTTLGGLIGMVEQGCIRASNVAFLNDREELIFGVRRAQMAMKVLQTDRRYKRWQKPLRAVMNEIVAGRIPNTYAACFATRPDLLSQWRGYGGSTQGVCISFQTSALVNAFGSQKAKLVPVVYGQLKGKNHILAELKATLKALVDAELTDAPMTEEAMEDAAYKALKVLLPLFKHLGFKEEEEWRFVVQHETTRASVKFRENGHVIVPYLELAMPREGSNKPGRLPIERVTIGPGKDMELTERSLALFFKTKGYAGVELKRSTIPFRA